MKKQLEKMSLCKNEEFLQELQMTQISNNSLKQLIQEKKGIQTAFLHQYVPQIGTIRFKINKNLALRKIFSSKKCQTLFFEGGIYFEVFNKN